MSTGTLTPYRSDMSAGRDGFGQMLRAEWTKFRTVRGWVIGLMVAVLVTVLLGLLAASGSHAFCNGQACNLSVPAGPGGEAVTDSFYFVHQPLAGNGSITVRVTSLSGGNTSHNPGGPTAVGLQPWSKAGIIIKESTRPGSAYAAMVVTGSYGVRMQYNYTADTAGLAGTVSTASPRWLRLTRSGDTITGYESANGTAWTKVGTASLAGLPPAVKAGLFATSPPYRQVTSQRLLGSGAIVEPTLATAVFDHVSLHGTRARGAWRGSLIGGGPIAGSPVQGGGYHQVGGRFTVSGSGDIAPAVAGAGNFGQTIEHSLVGAIAGLIALVVVAAMFITAEYQRGLIRTTLAASPRRGRVLAAKAIVISAVAFVAGLAAAAAAVLLGERLLHDNGIIVYPVTPLTEVRVVAGTAALLAIAAVLALGIGAIVRRSAAAVAAVIVVIVLPYILAVPHVLPLAGAQWLLRITPAAGFAIQQSLPQYPQVSNAYTPSNGYYPLAPWVGFAVLCGYAALALGLAIFLLRRRDA
jgi:ABC-type transport system involved in multi-copper enzyme maturation permease subunit